MSVRSGLKTLGHLEGKTETEFIGALGVPSAVKTLTSGRRLFAWQSGRVQAQMIAVLFDRNCDYLNVVAHYPNLRVTAEGVTDELTMSGFEEGRRVGIDLRSLSRASLGQPR